MNKHGPQHKPVIKLLSYTKFQSPRENNILYRKKRGQAYLFWELLETAVFAEDGNGLASAFCRSPILVQQGCDPAVSLAMADKWKVESLVGWSFPRKFADGHGFSVEENFWGWGKYPKQRGDSSLSLPHQSASPGRPSLSSSFLSSELWIFPTTSPVVTHCRSLGIKSSSRGQSSSFSEHPLISIDTRRDKLGNMIRFPLWGKKSVSDTTERKKKMRN